MASAMAIKLGGLLIKTLAKPVAKRLKNEAASRPELYQVCVDVGNWTHRATAWITVTSAGHKSIGVAKLEDQAAFTKGADFLSEAFIFGVGGGILVFEVNRANTKSAAAAAAEQARTYAFRKDLEERFTLLEKRVAELEGEQNKWSLFKSTKAPAPTGPSFLKPEDVPKPAQAPPAAGGAAAVPPSTTPAPASVLNPLLLSSVGAASKTPTASAAPAPTTPLAAPASTTPGASAVPVAPKTTTSAPATAPASPPQPAPAPKRGWLSWFSSWFASPLAAPEATRGVKPSAQITRSVTPAEVTRSVKPAAGAHAAEAARTTEPEGSELGSRVEEPPHLPPAC